MSEVVDSFVVGHWSVTRELTERHVSKPSTNVIHREMENGKFPKKVYKTFIETFSLERDLVLDIDSENGNFSFNS